jgi:hypothetical protein
MTKPQRRIGGNAALSIDDAGDAINRHVDLTRQLGGGNTEFAQLFGKVLAGMCGCMGHGNFPAE